MRFQTPLLWACQTAAPSPHECLIPECIANSSHKEQPLQSCHCTSSRERGTLRQSSTLCPVENTTPSSCTGVFIFSLRGNRSHIYVSCCVLSYADKMICDCQINVADEIVQSVTICLLLGRESSWCNIELNRKAVINTTHCVQNTLHCDL